MFIDHLILSILDPALGPCMSIHPRDAWTGKNYPGYPHVKECMHAFLVVVPGHNLRPIYMSIYCLELETNDS
jgi:hypothetical protein